MPKKNKDKSTWLGPDKVLDPDYVLGHLGDIFGSLGPEQPTAVKLAAIWCIAQHIKMDGLEEGLKNGDKNARRMVMSVMAAGLSTCLEILDDSGTSSELKAMHAVMGVMNELGIDPGDAWEKAMKEKKSSKDDDFDPPKFDQNYRNN
tara:strand:+ start:221 stop:661 length:441 start_codon:yes stop_codon:yes gene_type:complete